jgi:hypothetical protein
VCTPDRLRPFCGCIYSTGGRAAVTVTGAALGVVALAVAAIPPWIFALAGWLILMGACAAFRWRRAAAHSHSHAPVDAGGAAAREGAGGDLVSVGVSAGRGPRSDGVPTRSLTRADKIN